MKFLGLRPTTTISEIVLASMNIEKVRARFKSTKDRGVLLELEPHEQVLLKHFPRVGRINRLKFAAVVVESSTSALRQEMRDRQEYATEFEMEEVEEELRIIPPLPAEREPVPPASIGKLAQDMVSIHEELTRCEAEAQEAQRKALVARGLFEDSKKALSQALFERDDHEDLLHLAKVMSEMSQQILVKVTPISEPASEVTVTPILKSNPHPYAKIPAKPNSYLIWRGRPVSITDTVQCILKLRKDKQLGPITISDLESIMNREGFKYKAKRGLFKTLQDTLTEGVRTRRVQKMGKTYAASPS